LTKARPTLAVHLHRNMVSGVSCLLGSSSSTRWRGTPWISWEVRGREEEAVVEAGGWTMTEQEEEEEEEEEEWRLTTRKQTTLQRMRGGG
jgi:hypothetical protein